MKAAFSAIIGASFFRARTGDNRRAAEPDGGGVDLHGHAEGADISERMAVASWLDEVWLAEG